MNPRHRLSALTMLALVSPALAASDMALARIARPEPDPALPPIVVEGTPDTEPNPIKELWDNAVDQTQEVATKEPASSYVASLTNFEYTPSYPEEPTYPEGIIRDTPAIIMPIQPYPISPPLPDMTCLKPRRRKSRTPWRKLERGW